MLNVELKLHRITYIAYLLDFGFHSLGCQHAPDLATLSGVAERRLLPRPEQCSSGGKDEDPGTSTPG